MFYDCQPKCNVNSTPLYLIYDYNRMILYKCSVDFHIFSSFSSQFVGCRFSFDSLSNFLLMRFSHPPLEVESPPASLRRVQSLYEFSWPLHFYHCWMMMLLIMIGIMIKTVIVQMLEMMMIANL